MSKHFFFKGHNLSEYGLVFVLVGIALIGGLILFGATISGSLKGMVASMGQTTPGKLLTSDQEMQPSNAEQKVAITGTEDLPSGISAPSSGEFSPQSYINNITNTLETSGANGNTELLANTMKQMAKDLLAAGKITEAQSLEIIELSNQAYRMASAQKILEDAISSSSANPNFSNSMINVENKNYSVYELGKMLGWVDNKGATEPHDLLGLNKAGSLNSAFIQQYNKVLQSGAAGDPAVKALIDNMSSQITLSGELLVVITEDIANGRISVQSSSQLNKKVADYFSSYPEDLPGSNVISDQTTSNGNKICIIGNGTSNNRQCN